MNEEALHPKEGPGPRRPARRRAGQALDELFLSRYTVMRFENQANFHQLLLEMKAAWEPGCRAEELTVLRMTQCAWLLRRVDMMEVAFHEALVERTRKRTPDAHPAASLAAAYCGREETREWAFTNRMQGYRAMHEATLERLTNQLLRMKNLREANEVRALRAEGLRAENAELVKRAQQEGKVPSTVGILGRKDIQLSGREPGAERDADAGNTAAR